MIQKHNMSEHQCPASSDVEISVVDKNHRFATIEINYGWWRHNVSTYRFYISLQKFAPVSFSSVSCNGRGGVVNEKCESIEPTMTLDDVFNQVLERYQ